MLNQLTQRIPVRPDERVIAQVLHKLCPQRVADDVPHHVDGCLIVAKNTIEIALLPETLPVVPRVFHSGCLFPDFDELSKVSAGADSFSEQMHVVGHEAVRKNRKVEASGSVTKLQQRIFHGAPIVERAASISNAARQEISMKADV